MATYEEILNYLRYNVYPVRICFNINDSKEEKREKDNKKRSLRKSAASYCIYYL